jgi:hypothetical protein
MDFFSYLFYLALFFAVFAVWRIIRPLPTIPAPRRYTIGRNFSRISSFLQCGAVFVARSAKQLV